MVKLDAGVSGEGNAFVDLRRLPRPGARTELSRIGERVDAMRLQAAGVSLSDYLARLERGGIVEERIVGRQLRSPSVQMELGDGQARIVSTHDQILDGDGYIGCRFPAEPAYAGAITAAARRVGALLAEAGAIGRAAIDFVVVRDAAGDWCAYAIELNLRKGGTTHPLAALELLSGGAYDPESATFRAAVRLAAPLRRHGSSGVAEAEGARPQRPAEHGPAAGSGRLRRRLPHVEFLGRTRSRRHDRDRPHGRGRTAAI